MSETAPHPDRNSADRTVPGWAWSIPYGLAWGVFLAGEYFTASSPPYTPAAVDWLIGADDRLIYIVLLLAAPLVWWLAQKAILRPGSLSQRLVRRLDLLRAWLSAPSDPTPIRLVGSSLFVAGVSLAVSLAVGSRFGDLPPAYHDEYSYLLQSETFLAGRVWFPSHDGARLFDQMHVLNEGRFASRYFPGTGLWMAPFVAAGHPYWGHWLSGAICAMLMFWIGRELAGDSCGLIAGLLTALSPGMALFSNLLLAHHPTLVGLGVFILGVLRMVRQRSAAWGVVAGSGLAFATLCRPMTAAGVALPFGMYLLCWALMRTETRISPPLRKGGPGGWGQDVPRPEMPPDSSPSYLSNPPTSRRQRLLSLAAFAVPLLASAVGLFFYNRAITGDGWTTPYGVYMELHTPRHVYGFNNVKRGERHLGPRVIENYDKWAENLTPALAARNAGTRLIASWQWNLGILPLTIALAGGLVLWRHVPRGTWLILAAIISLHAVHIPYWFVGMEDYHYVFESGALWEVWTAVVSIVAMRSWRFLGRAAVCWWWGAMLVAAVLLNDTASLHDAPARLATEHLWSAPLEPAIQRVSFARRQHGRFANLVTQRALPHPALVLVDADLADRHIDYVINSPDLSGPVLIGHYLPDVVPISEVKRLFPERSLFLYRYRGSEESWQRLDTPQE